MRANYQRLSNYIRQVDVRNKAQDVSLLLGLSIEKKFITSIANTIGTDMSSYKIVVPMQFAYVPVTSRNGDKITIALYKGEERALISQAYTAFEITNTDALLPDYLMLWFKRPEFDRYARFKSHGSAREVFDWDEMCNVMLPVPPIEEQRRIVAQYQAVETRIRNNERLIARLEDTAQSIFRHHFVDNIDLNNLPDGWKIRPLGDIADFSYGKLPSKDENGDIPVFSGYAIVGRTNEEMFNEQHIIVIARGDSGSGKIVLSPHKFFLTNLAISINLHENDYMYYLYQHLLNADTYSLRSGSAQAQVTINDLAKFEVVVPPNKEMRHYKELTSSIYKYEELIEKENSVLKEMNETLISKL